MRCASALSLLRISHSRRVPNKPGKSSLQTLVKTSDQNVFNLKAAQQSIPELTIGIVVSLVSLSLRIGEVHKSHKSRCSFYCFRIRIVTRTPCPSSPASISTVPKKYEDDVCAKCTSTSGGGHSTTGAKTLETRVHQYINNHLSFSIDSSIEKGNSYRLSIWKEGKKRFVKKSHLSRCNHKLVVAALLQ